MQQKATFALGCFWEPDDHFSKLKGVISTTVGYTGGKGKNPSYLKVCLGITGHTEAIEILFDPKIVSYQELLKHFWKLHDPTELHKKQYASIIFYHSKEQQAEAEESVKVIEKKLGTEITTKVLPAAAFYPAEEYHQKYLQKRKMH